MRNPIGNIGSRIGAFLILFLLTVGAPWTVVAPAAGQHPDAAFERDKASPTREARDAAELHTLRARMPVPAYTIEATARGHEVSLEGYGNQLVPGMPVLPSKIMAIAIPPGAEVMDVVGEVGAGKTLPGTYAIAPARLPRVIGAEDPAVHRARLKRYSANFDAVYGRNDPYPANVVEFARRAGYRRYNLVDVRVTPFTYQPLTQRLTYYPDIEVRVDYRLPSTARSGMIDTLPRSERVARDLVLNYDEAQAWYPQAATSSRGLHDFVIITLDSLVSSVTPLVDWETYKGRNVEVVTTAWIDANYAGVDLAQKMRNFLLDKYPSGQWGIEDVLLVGHHTDVPMRRTAQDIGYGQPETDFYFAELSLPDEQSWDADGDQRYGESSDPIDFYTEINVGRIPYSEPGTVEQICQKSAAFEQNNDPLFKNNILLLGAYFWEDTDNAHLMEAKAGQPWMADWTMTRMYEKNNDYYSSFPCDYPLLRSNVLAVWGSGRFSFVNWAGHGSHRSSHIYGLGAPAFIDSADCSSLSDEFPSIIFADACSNAETDYDSIGRAMLGQGGVGFVGATKVALGGGAWNDPYDGSSQSLDYFFTSYVTSGEYTIGQAHQRALRDMYIYGLWDILRYETFEWGMLLGNPDLGIGEPAVLSLVLPEGAPSYADPAATTTFPVEIVGGIEGYVPGSGLLHYRFDEVSFLTAPLTHDADTHYEATLPAGTVYERLEFYVSAEGDAGTTVTNPADAPAIVHTALIGGFVNTVYEPLDTDPGWTTEGQWAFGQPTGGGGEYGGPDPTTGYTGPNVYGYNLSGDYANSLPERHLTSAPVDCSGLINTTLRFRRWLGVEQSVYDHAYVRVSPDGVNWTTIWENSGEIAEASWSLQEYDISAIADGQPTVYLRWTMGATDGGWRYCGWNIDDIELLGFVSCHDGIQNQSEERIDCGGPCAPCACLSDVVCDDALFCNGTEQCDAFGICQQGEPPCPPALCDEAADACGLCQSDEDCSDRLYCTGIETCEPGGTCQAGTPVVCDDGLDCTTDACSNVQGACTYTSDDALCDDGNVCTVDWCSGQDGCHNDGTGVTVPCNDGSLCTSNDACQGDVDGTCTGTTVAAPQAEADALTKNRYLSFVSVTSGQPTAVRITLLDLPSRLDAYEGQTLWVGAPGEYCENSGQSVPPPGGCGPAPGLESSVFVAAGGVNEPYYTDWSAWGTVHVHHALIVPGGVYELQAIGQLCNPDVETHYSDALGLTTAPWGDLVSTCETTPCGPPDGIVGIGTDVTAVLDKFKNLDGAVSKARCDLDPVDPDQAINITDVMYCLGAFLGETYPPAGFDAPTAP
jgi:hypothetical protein